jgi:hypothetical protein
MLKSSKIGKAKPRMNIGGFLYEHERQMESETSRSNHSTKGTSTQSKIKEAGIIF